MPSFDIVSNIDMHEASNASDQANREVSTRFDFKGSNAKFELAENIVTMRAESEFQLKQMLDILYAKLGKRGIDVRCALEGEPEMLGREARQTITLRQGIDTELARKLVKMIKESKLKLQAAIQGDQVRVSGKKRDGLQAAISLLQEAKLDLPLQYVNFRD